MGVADLNTCTDAEPSPCPYIVPFYGGGPHYIDSQESDHLLPRACPSHISGIMNRALVGGGPFPHPPHCPGEERRPVSEPLAREAETIQEGRLGTRPLQYLKRLPEQLSCHHPLLCESLLGSSLLSFITQPTLAPLHTPPLQKPETSSHWVCVCVWCGGGSNSFRTEELFGANQDSALSWWQLFLPPHTVFLEEVTLS